MDEYDDKDGLRAARGIINGLAVSLGIWALGVVVLIWYRWQA